MKKTGLCLSLLSTALMLLGCSSSPASVYVSIDKPTGKSISYIFASSFSETSTGVSYDEVAYKEKDGKFVADYKGEEKFVFIVHLDESFKHLVDPKLTLGNALLTCKTATVSTKYYVFESQVPAQSCDAVFTYSSIVDD